MASGAPASGPDRVAPEEAPSLPKVNFRITDETGLGQGTEGVKFKDNLNAIEILKALERDDRRATPDEQRALARYVGWGGLANAFADDKGEWKPDWQKRGEQLAALLTPEETRAARRSTRNAHYTSKAVIDAMWNAVDRMGFKGGIALELSSGTGNFLGLVPDHLAGRTRFIGVEYDSLTQRIAQQLYPQDTILHSGLQHVPLPEGEAVLNIGNPPFGSESLRFRFHPEYNGLSIHNQFFLAGLDALQPGGIHAAVVSRYLLDAQDTKARQEMAVRADLLGAIRLPETAFKENARTEVVTDIVFMRRRSPEDQAEMRRIFDQLADRKIEKANRELLEARVPDWVNTTSVKDPLGGEDIVVNRYFANRPAMIMGRLERSGSMRQGADVTVKMDKGDDLTKLLDAAVKKLPKDILHQDKDVIDASLARHEKMARALEIAVKGHEPGHIETKGDKLTQIYERETPTGGFELAERDLTPATPWSRQLKEDSQGRWYTLEPKVDEKGQKVKVEGSTRLVYDRKYFPNNEVPQGLRLGITRLKRLKEAVDLRDLTRKQIVMETNDAPTKAMEANRKALAEAYQRFTKRHGLLNEPSNAALVSDMPDGALVMALELNFRRGVSEARAKRLGEKPKPPSADPAPIMRTRVVPKFEPVQKVKTPQDALAVSLSDLGRVDMDRIAGLLDIPKETAIEKMTEGPVPLTYLDPEENQHVTRDAYLSGQVARKLNAARGAGLSDNVRDLERVQPARWTADQVNVLLGASWVPPQVYGDFASHMVGGKGIVQHLPLTNSFSVNIKNMDDGKHKQWRTDDARFEWLLSRILNSQPVKIIRTDQDGKTHVDEEATALAQLKAREIHNEFADWIFKDADRRNKLVDMFNEKFNTRVNRQFDGTHLQLPGKVPDSVITLRRNQKNAIWRGISSRSILLDHVVGAGKSYALIARMMERRRMGLSRKPLAVVPNHLVGQWTQDFLRLYPGAKILAASANQFDRANRRKLFAKIATGDWDAIIVPHSSFGFIGISPETEMRFLDDELRQAMAAIDEAWEQAREEGLDGGRRKPFNVKEAERLAEKIENRIDSLKTRPKDRLLTFEQMGIDDLTLDELQDFKNLYFSSRLTGVRGMGNKAGSAKAFDLYTKMRVLNEMPNGSYAFASGTPISNSAVEMYTVLRYLAPNELKELGLESFDAWRSQFVTAEAKFEPTESGSGLKEVTRLGRSWSNMRSLMELWHSVTDSVTQEDLNKWHAEDNEGARFPVPPVKGGNRKEVVVKPTPAQQEMLTDVVADFNSLPGIKDPFERNKERLRLMDRARKLSLDVRAANPHSASLEEGGKLDQIADNVARIHKQWTPDAGTQLVFLDRSVRAAKGDDKIIKEYDTLVQERDKAVADGNEAAFQKIADALDKFDPNEIEELRRAQAGGWNAYDQLKKNLIARGVPADEIRFVQEANNDVEKQALFDAVNDGLVRVLIGSTPRMGAGTNVQERIVALHHGDVTWKPSDIEQREGRGIRQGNKLLAKYGHDKFELEILAYVTERTVDAKMWDLNATKLRMVNGVRKYDGSFTMEFDDEDAVGMAEIAALASGDPMLLERVKLQSEIDKLELLERAHRRKMFGVEDRIHDTERQIERLPDRIKRERAQAAEMNERVAALDKGVAKRSMEVEGQKVTSPFDAHKAAEDAIKAQQAGNENAKYTVNVDGKRLTNKADIENAIRGSLGDQVPFEMVIDKKPVILRAAAAKLIADKAHDLSKKVTAAGEHEAERLGKMLGYDLDLEVSADQYRNRLIALHLDKDGRTVASGQHQRGDAMFTPAGARAAIDDLEKHVKTLSYDRSASMEQQLVQAKKDLPDLMKERGQPFKQAPELSEKRKRLEEVIRELAGRAEAAEKGGPKGPDTEPGGAPQPMEFAHAEPSERDLQAARDWIGGEVGDEATPEDIDEFIDRLRNGDTEAAADLKESGAPDEVVAPFSPPEASPEEGTALFHKSIEIPRDKLPLAYRKRLEQVETIIRDLIRQQVGSHVEVKFPFRIDPVGQPHGYEGTDVNTIFGSYRTMERVIQVALAHGDPRILLETAFHEPFHAVQDFLATDRERALLKASLPALRELVRRHPRHGAGADTYAPFEIEAMAYQMYGAERATGGTGADTGLHIGIRRLFEKIFRFFRRLGNWMRRLGFQTWEDFFGKAYEGGLKDRPARPGSRLTEEIMGKEAAHAAREAGLPAKTEAISSHADPSILKARPEYAAAKAGDVQAAARLVEATVKPSTFKEALDKFGTDALYTPVVAEEATGPNRIPAALAELYAARTGADTARGIVQVTRAFHTGAKAMERLMVRPVFDGPVKPGGRYVLVDDVTVIGSTLAELSHHITANGGQVIGVVTLVNASRGGVLSPRPGQVREIARRFGNAVRDLFHVDPGALTGAEATYLLNFRDVDALRDRAAAAGRQRVRETGCERHFATDRARDGRRANAAAPIGRRRRHARRASRLPKVHRHHLRYWEGHPRQDCSDGWWA